MEYNKLIFVALSGIQAGKHQGAVAHRHALRREAAGIQPVETYLAAPPVQGVRHGVRLSWRMPEEPFREG